MVWSTPITLLDAPGWIYPVQDRQMKGLARKYNVPILTLFMAVKRLNELKDSEVDRTSMNHIKSTVNVRFGNPQLGTGEFKLNINVNIDWFCFVEPTQIFQIPRAKDPGDLLRIRIHARGRVARSQGRIGRTCVQPMACMAGRAAGRRQRLG